MTLAHRFLVHVIPPLFAAIIFTPSLGAGLLFDDYRNTGTARWLHPTAILEDFQKGSRSGNHYRPLEPISYRFDNFIWNGAPHGYHLSNILAHCIAVWLLTQIVLTLFNSTTLAILVGLLFAAHPISVSAVGWIAGRTTGLVTCLLLLSTYLYIRLIDTRRHIFLFGSLVAFILALLAKEQAYFFPFFLIALHYWRSAYSLGTRSPLPLFHFIISALLFIGAFALMMSPLSTSTARYAPIVATLGAYFLLLGVAIRVKRDRILLALYGIIPVIVFFGLLIPSGVLDEPHYTSSPFLWTPKRIAFDLYVLLTSVGVVSSDVRELMVAWAINHPPQAYFSWIACVIVVAVALILTDRKTGFLLLMLSLALAIAPMRLLPPTFFTLANMYLAAPIGSLILALAIRWLSRSVPRLEIFVGALLITVFAYYSYSLQTGLVKMGKFSVSLYSILEGRSRTDPGPFLILVNVPDPFKHTPSVVAPSYAFSLAFRVAQSALELGGYTEENTTFAGKSLLQIATLQHSPCELTADTLSHERIKVTLQDQNQLDECLEGFQYVDFYLSSLTTEQELILQHRKLDQVRDLRDAELYVFDWQQEQLKLQVQNRSQ